MPNQLVVIDRKVANYQSLIDQLGTAYSYLLLDSNSDGLTQIANYVSANPGFDAIHLISHGSPGQVAVGTSTLSEATLGEYSAQLNQIGASLNAGGDLLIYGCDVAQGVGGQQLVTDLSRLTRLDVAASTNRTGGTGDWILESATGPVSYQPPEFQYFDDLASAPGFVWTRFIGSIGTISRALTTGPDGSVYVAGTTKGTTLDGQINAGGNDAFVIKYTPDGTKVWTRLIGTTQNDSATALTTGSDGSLYVASIKSDLSATTITSDNSVDVLTKFAPDGTKIWTKQLGATTTSLTTGLDGSLYVAGYAGSGKLDGQSTAGQSDAFVTKLSPDGTKIWTKLVGSTSQEIATALTTGLDGSLYLAGWTLSTTLDGLTTGSNGANFMTKFAPDGTKIWTKLINAPVSAMSSGPAGSWYVAGDYYGTPPAGLDVDVTGFEPNGTKVWTQIIRSDSNESVYGLTTSSDGSLYVAGYTGSSMLDGETAPITANGSGVAFVTKFGLDGTKIWTHLFGIANTARVLTAGLDGSLYIAGDTRYNNDLYGEISSYYYGYISKITQTSTPPTIVITSDKASLSAGQTATLSFALSAPSTDFVLGDISVSGGKLSNFGGSGKAYSVIFTPSINSTAKGVVTSAD